MKSDSYIIKTTGEIVPVVPENKTDFKLKEVQKICNDCVEVVFDNNQTCMIASENALSLGFELNFMASLVATRETRTKCYILGDVLVCKSDMFR